MLYRWVPQALSNAGFVGDRGSAVLPDFGKGVSWWRQWPREQSCLPKNWSKFHALHFESVQLMRVQIGVMQIWSSWGSQSTLLELCTLQTFTPEHPYTISPIVYLFFLFDYKQFQVLFEILFRHIFLLSTGWWWKSLWFHRTFNWVFLFCNQWPKCCKYL